jgi:hypothetical protein
MILGKKRYITVYLISILFKDKMIREINKCAMTNL